MSRIEVDAEARELLDRIAARELRDAIAAERERRERLYRAARAAAEVWLPRIADDPHVERLRRHAVDLALEEPAITVHWLRRDGASLFCRSVADRVVFWRVLTMPVRKKPGHEIAFSGPVLLVAGAGFEPATFGL